MKLVNHASDTFNNTGGVISTKLSIGMLSSILSRIFHSTRMHSRLSSHRIEQNFGIMGKYQISRRHFFVLGPFLVHRGINLNSAEALKPLENMLNQSGVAKIGQKNFQNNLKVWCCKNQGSGDSFGF